MTRFLLGLALLMFAAGTASAQQVKSVEVYEFGTYVASGFHYTHPPSSQGIKIEGHDGYTHLETTRTITAKIGARFGFRYRVTGTTPGVYAPLKMVWKFPPPGIVGSDPTHPVELEVVEFDATVERQLRHHHVAGIGVRSRSGHLDVRDLVRRQEADRAEIRSPRAADFIARSNGGAFGAFRLDIVPAECSVFSHRICFIS